MVRRRRSRRRRWRSPARRLLLALLLLVAGPLGIYLVAATAGAAIPVNRGWTEPKDGITVYLADNGVHTDIVFPARAQGLDWRRLFGPADFAIPDSTRLDWVMIGAGDKAVYTEAKTWVDVTPAMIASALTRGDLVMHVQWVDRPDRWATSEIRLRPEEYRRLFAAARASFTLDSDGRPQRLDAPGYFGTDAFYESGGSFNALSSCNNWVAGRLRIAGVRTSLWNPLPMLLPLRYRKAGQST